MSLLVILLRAILHPPWEMRRKAHLGCTNAPCVPVAGIAKYRRFGRLAAPIQAKLSRPTIGAALDLPFDKATSTSASVSPTTDVGATSLRDVEEPEAHLVVGALAPVQLARSDPAGLVLRAVVPVALDRQAVARLHPRRDLQGVRPLPVEVPAGAVEQAFLRAVRAPHLEAIA